MRTDRRTVLAGGIAFGMVGVAGVAAPTFAKTTLRRRWSGAWGAALQGVADAPLLPAGSVIVQSAVVSLSGKAIRLRLSNQHGMAPLVIAGASVRVAGGSATSVRFADDGGIAIPPGAAILSDGVDLSIAHGQRIEVAITLARPAPATNAQRTADRKGAKAYADATRTTATDIQPIILSEIDVAADRAVPVLAILSDTKSAGPGAWPDRLSDIGGGRIGVVNRSVFGGLLALGPPSVSAIARFDRDVLATAGVSHALIFAGNNDLIQPGMAGSTGKVMMPESEALSVAQLTALLAQTATRARDAGLKAVGGTWLPYEGVTIAQGYSTPEKLAKREAVNRWIRSTGAFDAVIDFDAALRDPAHPARLLAEYDSGNRFTPSDAGYRRMAQVAVKALLG